MLFINYLWSSLWRICVSYLVLERQLQSTSWDQWRNKNRVRNGALLRLWCFQTSLASWIPQFCVFTPQNCTIKIISHHRHTLFFLLMQLWFPFKLECPHESFSPFVLCVISSIVWSIYPVAVHKNLHFGTWFCPLKLHSA